MSSVWWTSSRQATPGKALGVALVVFVFVQRVGVVAADPPLTSARSLANARRPLPPVVQTDEMQIVLQVRIVEIDHEKLSALGISMSAFTQDQSSTTRPSEATTNAVQFTSLDNIAAELLINSLRANGVAKILAEPVIVSAAGRPARFRSGSEIPLVAAESEGTAAIEFREFGTLVDFTANEQASGDLRVEIRVVQSDIDESRTVKVDGNRIPGLRSRSIDTAFEVQPGQTVMLYGKVGDHLLLMVTPEVIEPAQNHTQNSAAQPQPVPVDKTVGFQEPTERSLAAAKIEAESKLKSLTEHFGPQHPDVVAQWNQIEAIAEYKANLDAERIEQQRREAEERHEQRRIRSVNEFAKISQDLFPGADVDLREVGDGVILSGNVNDKEQARALSAIAENLFPHVINNLRTSDTSAPRRDTGEELQETLAELFPDANLKVRPLNSSVLLSGTIEGETAKQAVEIANDFYPNVIDHTRQPNTKPLPSGSNVTPAAEQTTGKANSINTELHALREDVRVLRRDVSRLIDLLEGRDGTSLNVEPSADDHSSDSSADADEAVWQLIGIRAEPAEVESDKYRGGLKILGVRKESPAAKEGIQQGDILVGLDKWETVDLANLQYVVGQIDERKPASLKFYVLRGENALIGHMKLAALAEEPILRELWDVTLDEVVSIGLRNSKAIRNLGGVRPFGFEGKQEVVLSRVNKEASLADFETAVRNHVSDTEATYWELWAARRDLDTASESRDAAQELWNEVYERMKGGEVNPQAETQAREQYFFFRDQCQSAVQELNRREGKLRLLIGLATSDSRRMRAVDEPTTDKYTIDFEDAKKNALSNSVALRQQRRVVRQAELELASAKASFQPQLDIAALYRWSGVAGEIELDKSEAGEIGFEFQLPVGLRRAAAGVRNATLNVAREKARLEEMERKATHLLTTAIRDADFLYQSATTHFNRWVATHSEVESTTTLYKGGKTTLDLVLDAQRRLAQSTIDYTSSLAQYMTAIKDVHFRQGSLLAEHNLVIEMAEEPLAAFQAAEGAIAPRSAAIPDPTVELKPGDRLTIESLADDSLDRHVTILPDGTITLPLLGQVATAGHTLLQMQEAMKIHYGKFYRDPAILLSYYGTCVRVMDADTNGSAFAQLENVPDPTADLKPGDQLFMESLVDPILNRRLTILGDGSITLPLLGQIQAGERTLQELKEELEEHYKGRYKQPSLTLSFTGTSLPARK